MRNALLILLMLNALIFFYQKWIIEPADPVDALFIEQDVPGLMPAKRLAVADDSDGEAPAEIGADGEDAPSNPGYRCLQIGPFAQVADAEQVRTSLQRREATVRQVTEEGQVWVGHWVQVVDMASRAQAEQSRDVLVQGGMPDAYIVPGADDFRISLGVFRQRSSADNTVRSARLLGFQTRVDDRYQPGTNFWLRVRMPADRNLRPGEFKSDNGQILRTETIQCAGAGI